MDPNGYYPILGIAIDLTHAQIREAHRDHP